MDWQSLIAVGIVALTLTVFLLRIVRRRPKSGCGHGCDCGKNFPKPH